MICRSEPASGLRLAHPGLLLVLLALNIPAAASLAATTGSEDAEGSTARSATVLRLVDGSAGPVPAVWRQAVVLGLSAVAASEEVILCPAGHGRQACSPELLDIVPELRWSVSTAITVKHSLALIRVPLTLELVVDPESTAPEAGLFVIEDNLVLPEGATEGHELDTVVAHRVRQILTTHTAVRRWFASVAQTSDLRRLVPFPEAETDLEAADQPTSHPTAANTEDEAAEWRHREEEILSLLIDGRFIDARQAADRLLQEDGLPPDQRDRVVRLRATALEREAAVDEQPEPSESPASKAKETFDFTFRVRVAVHSQGFVRGTDGRLRLYAGGVRFVPDTTQDGASEDGDGWFLRWSEIRAWGEAEGLWDISHPLELISTDGENLYLAVIDRDGLFRSGERLLSMLSEGAELARKR